MPWTAGQPVTAAQLNQYAPQTASVSQAAATGDLTVTASMTQVPGMSLAVSGAGTTSRYIVHVGLDISILNADNQVNWQLYVDGVAFGAVGVLVVGSVTRWSSSRTQYVTGLSAGSHTFSVRASRTGTAGGSIVRGTHSILVVDCRG